MTGVTAALCGVLGLCFGSFVNVVIWRVPRGESVVAPPSRCPSCQAAIAPYDNLPVISWLLLGGRCRRCQGRISARYPMVELLTGGLFAAVAARFGVDPVLPAYLYLAAVGVALALIDLDVKRLPDVITLPSYLVGGVLLGLAALSGSDTGELLKAGLGMAALFAIYFALAFAYPAGMGFGDVKLAGVLGLYLGWLGWRVWAVGLLAGFIIGGLAGIVVLASGRGSRKTAIPFGPFMILGAFLAVFAGGPIARAWLGA